MAAAQLLIAAMLAAAVGVASPILGLAGGTLLTPLLILAGLEPHVAVAAGYAAALAGGLGGAAHLAREGLIDERLYARLAPPAVLGAALGAYASLGISPRLLQALIAASLAASAALLYAKPRIPPSAATAAALAAGLLAGATGKGGGSLYTPIAAALARDSRIAATTSRLLAATTAAAAAAAYTAIITAHPHLILAVAASAYTGSEAGSRLLTRITPARHKTLTATAYTTLSAIIAARTALHD